MINAVMVFIALFLLDFVWASYTEAVSLQQPIAASIYASMIIVLSGFAAIGYVSDHWMLIPATMGAFSGTFVAVQIAKNRP